MKGLEVIEILRLKFSITFPGEPQKSLFTPERAATHQRNCSLLVNQCLLGFPIGTWVSLCPSLPEGCFCEEEEIVTQQHLHLSDMPVNKITTEERMYVKYFVFDPHNHSA